MLVISVEDGLTVGNRLYRKGEIFRLEAHMEVTLSDFNAERMARYQIKLYGKPYFRRATAEEIFLAYTGKTLSSDLLDPRERRVVAEMLVKAKAKQNEATEKLLGDEAKAIIEMAEEEQEREEMEAKEQELKDLEDDEGSEVPAPSPVSKPKTTKKSSSQKSTKGTKITK